jgi:acyl-CoA reductase-like NAD-dependent aldehyde dehydrogenase
VPDRILQERKEQYARDMTREMGKVLAETRGDVQEAIDEAFYVAGEGRRLFGVTTPSELQNKFAMSVRMPVGVVGMITPWNFPMAIPSWKLFPALVSGNTCVIKPAEDTPLSTYNLVQTLIDAGLASQVWSILLPVWDPTLVRRSLNIQTCAPSVSLVRARSDRWWGSARRQPSSQFRSRWVGRMRRSC